MTDKILRSIQGYQITKKGYTPTKGDLTASPPPKGGSGMASAPAPANNNSSSSGAGQTQSAGNDK